MEGRKKTQLIFPIGGRNEEGGIATGRAGWRQPGGRRVGNKLSVLFSDPRIPWNLDDTLMIPR